MLLNLILFVQIISCGFSWEMVPEYLRGSVYTQDEVSYSYIRCTRRFSPGACAAPLQPVWTFVFAAQNCTERLGCPRDKRANRFRSYANCIRRCQTLVDLYTHILASDSNQTFYLRNDTRRNDSRREGDDIIPVFHDENKEIYAFDDSELEQLENDYKETDDIDTSADIFAPNIYDEEDASDGIRILEDI